MKLTKNVIEVKLYSVALKTDNLILLYNPILGLK